MGRIITETERLIVREWETADVESFGAIAADPRVVRFITGGVPVPAEQTAEMVGRLISLQESHGWTRWALQLRHPAHGEPTGVVGFCGPGCTFAPFIEVGWWVHADLWGRGLATEAARAVVHQCFDVIGFDLITCCVHPDNAASLAVARKAGFEPKARFEFNGIPLIRHEQANPLPDPPRDPRFIRTCDGAQAGSAILSPTADAG